MIRIRLFERKDASQLVEVARKACYYTYKEILTEQEIKNFIERNYNEKNLLEGNNANNSFWVAEDNGKIIGYLQIGIKEEEMRLWRLYLDPSYIGKGIGSMLLSEAEKFMIKKGIRRYALEIHPKIEAKFNFYPKKSFYKILKEEVEGNSDKNKKVMRGYYDF